MLAMVCDLPVPGGPSSTKLCPATAAATQARWEASASRTSGTSSGGASRSMSAAGIGSKPGSPSRAASARTIGWARMRSSLSCRSRYMASLWKLNVESRTVSSTCQPGRPATAARTRVRNSARSRCASSPTAGRSTPSRRIRSTRAGLTTGSSSRARSRGRSAGPAAVSSTGSSRIGLACAVPSSSRQCSMPIARCRASTPRSRKSWRALRMRRRSTGPRVGAVRPVRKNSPSPAKPCSPAERSAPTMTPGGGPAISTMPVSDRRKLISRLPASRLTRPSRHDRSAARTSSVGISGVISRSQQATGGSAGEFP